jgi:hypothetical protein
VQRICRDTLLGIKAATVIRGFAHVRRMLADWAITAAVEMHYSPEKMMQLFEHYFPEAQPN